MTAAAATVVATGRHSKRVLLSAVAASIGMPAHGSVAPGGRVRSSAEGWTAAHPASTPALHRPGECTTSVATKTAP
jgi:hypothetical protein